MCIVAYFDEWLYFRSLGLTSFRHAARDLRWVTFNTSYKGVRERVRLRSSIESLNDNDLIREVQLSPGSCVYSNDIDRC